MRFLLVLLALVLFATPASAEQVDITAQVDESEIELGDTVTYTLQATSSGDAPSDPKLAVTPGFTLIGASASPTHMMSIINGRASEKRGLTASWQLRSDRLGIFTIGPGTVAVGGGRKSATAQRVTVVAPGRGRPKRRGNPFDPFGRGGSFDPFKGIFPDFDDDRPEPAVPTDPKFTLPAARGQTVFLHATVDKTRAVVGEQVTLNVYLYEDNTVRQGRPSDVHESTATDFIKRSLLTDETHATHVGNTIIDGRIWAVKLVRKNALFPLKAGHLEISPMSLSIPQARIGVRESETLTVDVTEPPIANRPAGYQIGDTGDFSLSAETKPRTVEQHGAIGVTVELRGNGNMPATLPLPEVAGVEWLEPQTRDALGPVQNEHFGGTRTFSYVVRIHRDGAIDLGEIRLPYFDPQSRTYQTARASLGIVQVTKSDARDAGPEVAETVLPNLPKARPALEGRREASFVAERSVFWFALFGSPLACVLAIASASAVRKVRERRASAAPSPARIARDRRSEAERALASSDGTAAVGAIVRAVEAGVLAASGVNVRGAAKDDVRGELVDAGISESAARAALDVLAACEDARFAPSGVDIETARALWTRATEALAAIEGAS